MTATPRLRRARAAEIGTSCATIKLYQKAKDVPRPHGPETTPGKNRKSQIAKAGFWLAKSSSKMPLPFTWQSASMQVARGSHG